MTSQKSLKNNVNFNDFKRSFLDSLIFPIIAFVVLFASVTFPLIDYVTSEQFKTTPIHNEVQVFVSDYSFVDVSMLFMGMVCCGILVAVKSFGFLVSKKQVNVFLSQGVTRTTMFVNRVVSGVITLFISTLIPILIVYFINIDKFGLTAHLTSTFLYFVSGLFVNGLAGFSIGSFAMMIAGNVFEAGLTTVAISIIPIMVVNIGTIIRDYFLKGYYHDYTMGFNYTMLTPFTFTDVYKTYYNGEYQSQINTRNLFETITKDMLVDGKIPEAYKIDSTFIMPVVLWFVVSVVFMALAWFLINKRKAEHANSFGHFAVSRAICSTCVFTIAAYLAFDIAYYELSNNHIVITFLLCALAGLLTFFLAQLIMARKIKTVVKALPICAVLICTMALGFVTADTGVFGQYNKTPVKEDVKSVAISFDGISLFSNLIYTGNEYVKSTDSKDIDMVLKLYDEIKKEEKNVDEHKTSVVFAFENKDGETQYREFSIYSDKLYEEYLKNICNSDYFDALAERELLGFSDKGASANGKYYLNKKSNQFEGIIYDGDKMQDENLAFFWRYTDNQMIVRQPMNAWDGDDGAHYTYKGDEFAVALYNDVTKMTYEDFFKNNSRPLGIISSGIGGVCVNGKDMLKPSDDEWDKYRGGLNIEEEYVGETVYYYVNGEKVGTDLSKVIVDSIVGAWLYVYPQMTETIKYLEDNNIEFDSQYKGEIKEILYTNSPVTFGKAFKKYAEVNESRFDEVMSAVEFEIFETNYFSQDSFDNLMDFINEDTKYYDLFKSVYKTAEHPLLTLNSSKTDEVLNKCVPHYLTLNDNGRYVYIVYEDGTMVCQYLPEANVGVLK